MPNLNQQCAEDLSSDTPRAAALKPRSGSPLDGESQTFLRKLIADYGIDEAARMLGVPRNTLAPAAAGAGARAGTKLLFANAIQALKAAASK